MQPAESESNQEPTQNPNGPTPESDAEREAGAIEHQDSVFPPERPAGWDADVKPSEADTAEADAAAAAESAPSPEQLAADAEEVHRERYGDPPHNE